MKKRTAFKYAFSIGLAGALFWYLYADKDFGETLKTLSSVNYAWVALSFLCAGAGHYSRAARSVIMLRAVGFTPKPGKVFLTVMLGYFVNIFVPRAGEIARCGMLQKLEGVPADVSLGAVVAERAIDLLMLLGILGLVMLFEYDVVGELFLSALGNSQKTPPAWLPWLAAGLAVAAVIGGLSLLLFKDKIKASLFYQKALAVLQGVKAGLFSVLSLRPKDRAVFVFHTFFIWTMYYMMGYVLLFSLEITSGLAWGAGLSLLVAGGLGMAAPTPGGAGSYHFFISKTLVAYGLTENASIDFALMMHSSQTVFVLAGGGIAFLSGLLLPEKDVVGN